jgi:hypothetical protein
VSKEREIAEAIWADLDDRRGFGFKSLQWTDPDTHEMIISAHCEIIRRLLTTTAEISRSASEPESEAVMLLRALYTAINSRTLHVETVRNNEAVNLTDLMVKIDSFLSRSSGPDWRKLAVDAASRIAVMRSGGDWATNTKAVYAVFEVAGNIRDALAAEKGGK